MFMCEKEQRLFISLNLNTCTWYDATEDIQEEEFPSASEKRRVPK